MSRQLHSISLVIPVYNEEAGLPELFSRLDLLISNLKFALDKMEVILVDDHSSDQTPLIIKAATISRPYLKYLRLAKNSGSHISIIAGMSVRSCDAVVFLAADLQDPPELILELITKWEEEYDVVWAVRKSTEGVSVSTGFFSRLFYRLMNASSSVKLPPAGADFALLDKRVADALVKSAGSNPSIVSLIVWLGYRQTEIYYVKQARKFGKSNWTLTKKLNALLDAFVGFSYMPMRLMSYFGFLMAFLGFLYVLLILYARIFSDKPIQGWASLMVVVLIIGGAQMIMLGVLGEYLWRNLEESRKRPLFLFEENQGFQEKL